MKYNNFVIQLLLNYKIIIIFFNIYKNENEILKWNTKMFKFQRFGETSHSHLYQLPKTSPNLWNFYTFDFKHLLIKTLNLFQTGLYITNIYKYVFLLSISFMIFHLCNSFM